MTKENKIMWKNVLKTAGLCLVIIFLIFRIGCHLITGEKTIHRAAFEGDLEKVKIIISRDHAQVNILDNSDQSPLYYASAAGHTEIVKFLLAHGANIEAGNDKDETPLAKAARFNHYDTVKTLLEHGAETNCRDFLGRTPLHEATVQSGKEMIDLLISYGADISARNKYDSTPLHEAVSHNQIKAAKALVENGADLFAKNHFDYERYRQLFDAAKNGDKKAEKEFEKIDTLPPPEDMMNKTPKEIALARGYKELAQYLQEKEEESLKKEKSESKL